MFKNFLKRISLWKGPYHKATTFDIKSLGQHIQIVGDRLNSLGFNPNEMLKINSNEDELNWHTNLNELAEDYKARGIKRTTVTTYLKNYKV